MSTITKAGTTITPTLVLGYKAASESSTVFHKVIGRPDSLDASLAADGLRTGELQLFFAGRAEAWAAYRLHSTPGVFVFVHSEIPEASMTYVRAGSKTIELDPTTRVRWLVTIGFQEVTA